MQQIVQHAQQTENIEYSSVVFTLVLRPSNIFAVIKGYPLAKAVEPESGFEVERSDGHALRRLGIPWVLT